MPHKFKVIQIDNDSLLILLKDKQVIISKKTAFILDKTIMKILFKKDILEENFEHLEIITNFMDCRDVGNEYRQFIILSDLYDEIKDKLKDTKESLPLFRGHFTSAKYLLGDVESSEEEELISLAKHLENICTGVVIISESLPSNEDFCRKTSKRTFVTDLSHIAPVLRLIPNFYNYLHKKYFDSSA